METSPGRGEERRDDVERVSVVPALAEYSLRHHVWTQYSLWLLMRHQSPYAHGCTPHELVGLSHRVRWVSRSRLYAILKAGEGVWWTLGPDGRYRHTAIRRLLVLFDIRPHRPPRLVPLADFREPKSALYATIFRADEPETLSRAAITKRTGLSKPAQIRLEEKLARVTRVTQIAELDGAVQAHDLAGLQAPTRRAGAVDADDQWGGVFTRPDGSMCRRMPNQYQTLYAEAPYGRARRRHRNQRCSRSARGQTAQEQLPNRRYRGAIPPEKRAKQPRWSRPLRDDELCGGVFVRDGDRLRCTARPMLKTLLVAKPRGDDVRRGTDWQTYAA